MKLFDIATPWDTSDSYQLNMYKRMLNTCYGAYGESRWNMTDNDRVIRAMCRYIENDIDITARLGKRTLPRIKDVIFNRPATIVFWADNTKTVVKCSKNDVYDPEKGLAMANHSIKKFRTSETWCPILLYFERRKYHFSCDS